MWCARLPLSRPDSTVVVHFGRNEAALGSPFFLIFLYCKLGDSKCASASDNGAHLFLNRASITATLWILFSSI
jgi:hypothetical protein